jgi:hypothetical protein
VIVPRSRVGVPRFRPGRGLAFDEMTAILFIVLLGAVLWGLGLSGLLRWAGIAGAALGLGVVLGVDPMQGVPLLVGGCLVWLIGRALAPAGLQRGSYPPSVR